MSNLLSNIQHVYASVATKIVAEAKFIESKVLPALKLVNAEAPVVEAVAGAINPAAENISRIAFAALGAAIKALDDAGTAVSANGLNVSFDTAFIADLKAIAPAVKAAASTTVPSVQ